MSKKQSGVVLVLDVLFIMILCFVTLFSTMLMRGSVIVGSESADAMKYSFGAISFLVTFAGLGVYLYYILPHSKKELKGMINELYDPRETK